MSTSQHSTSEVGIQKNIANFDTLIATATALGPAYQPSKASLKLPALQAKATAVKAAVTDTSALHMPFIQATGDRKTTYANIKKLSTRILGAIRLTDGVNPSVLAEAVAINRKIQGASAPAAPSIATGGDDPETAQPPTGASTSQQSFTNIAAHFADQVALINSLPAYGPSETELQLATLESLAATLANRNSAVTSTYAPYSTSRIARDKHFNDPDTGLVDIAQYFKTYLKTAFGATSPEYKTVSKLKFVNID